MSNPLRRFIVPKPGRVVPDPAREYRRLPEQGASVNWTGYWQRRLREGAIEVREGPETQTAARGAGRRPSAPRTPSGT